LFNLVYLFYIKACDYVYENLHQISPDTVTEESIEHLEKRKNESIEKMVELLLTNKADPNLKDKLENTPLHYGMWICCSGSSDYKDLRIFCLI
jgi:hypothetical protein